MRTLIFLIFAMSSIFASAQTAVPFLKKDGKYIFVDASTMKPVSKQEFDRLPEVLSPGYTIDKNGNLVPSVSSSTENMNIANNGGFEVYKNEDGWYGYKNKQGKLIIPCNYEKAESFSENRAFVKIARNEGGYIDTTGKMIFSFKGSIRGSAFSEGFARMANFNYTFFVDKEGNIKLIFADNATDMGNIVQSFSLKPIDKSKIVSIQGYRLGISEDESFGTDDGFHEGLLGIIYKKNNGGDDNSCAFIDKSGNFIIPIKDYIFECGYNKGFKRGYAILKTKNGKEFNIDKKGKEFLEK
jgi:hypothetical protein